MSYIPYGVRYPIITYGYSRKYQCTHLNSTCTDTRARACTHTHTYIYKVYIQQELWVCWYCLLRGVPQYQPPYSSTQFASFSTSSRNYSRITWEAVHLHMLNQTQTKVRCWLQKWHFWKHASAGSKKSWEFPSENVNFLYRGHRSSSPTWNLFNCNNYIWHYFHFTLHVGGNAFTRQYMEWPG